MKVVSDAGFPVLLAAWLAVAPARALGVGDPAPAFALPTAQGASITLEQLRGRVVYVDFWASWCAPCQRSFPWMNAMHQRYGEHGLTIVAVNVDERRPEAERFLQRYPAEFTVVYDATGATPSAYGVKAMPSSYFIDAQGRIAAIEHGFRDAEIPALEARMRALLGVR